MKLWIPDMWLTGDVKDLDRLGTYALTGFFYIEGNGVLKNK
jgi:hypothetical protein